MTQKQQFVILGSIFVLVLILLYVFMPEGIVIEPLVTPLNYLDSKPSVEVFNRWTIIVPSSTIIVYLLGVQILYVGYAFIKNKKTLWGIAFLFWGLGTLLAGTSYQGFGYELKCAGNEYCQFTSWFELAYLFTTAISIAVMALAFADEFTTGRTKLYLKGYGKGALVLYTIILVLGSVLENRVLISYELFTVFFMPLFVVFFILNIKNYKTDRNPLDKAFINLWILFLFVNVAYYLYYILGFTETLYENTGIWFSANDVLHVGLILWFGYIQFNIVDLLIKKR